MIDVWFEVFVPRLTPGNSASKLTWQKQAGEKRKWLRDYAILARPQLPPEPYEFANVQITRCTVGSPPDYDNLLHSAKWALDALCPPKRGKFQIPSVIADDGPLCIGRPELLWFPVPGLKKQGVRIRVVPLPRLENLDLTPWPTLMPTEGVCDG